VIAPAFAAFFLAVLAWLSVMPNVAEHSSLMLVMQSPTARAGISPALVQSLQDEGLMLTYEIPATATVEAVNARHQVTLVGTNSSYLEVTGHRLVSGGFFPHSAWEGKRRQATLNKTAAAQIFGSTNIDGQIIIIDGLFWMVTGVVDDGAGQTLIIYAPSSLTGGHARSLMVATRAGGAGWSCAVNTLAGFGIREGEYDFVNLSTAANAGAERFSLALKIALCIVILLLGAKGLSLIKTICAGFVKDLASHYPREILAKRKSAIAKASVAAALLAGVAAVVMNLSLRILVTVIGWREVSLPAWYPGADFAGMIAWLRNYHTFGAWIFRGYLAAIFTAAIQIITMKKRRGGDMLTGARSETKSL